MTTHYKIVSDFEQAEAIVESLENIGVKREDINIIITQSQHGDTSKSALLDDRVTIKDAPEGTVNAFGASFAALTAVSAGVAFFVAGPIFAALAGTLVAGSGVAMLISGVGVPEEELDDVIAQLEAGQVFIHVDSDNPEVAALLR